MKTVFCHFSWLETSNTPASFSTPPHIITVPRSAGPSQTAALILYHSETLRAKTKVSALLSVKQPFIITPLQQSVSVWCKADLPQDLSSTWLSIPPLAFSLTSLCPSPHLSIHHLAGQRKSINPSTPSLTPLDWWEGGQETGEPRIFHNIFVTLERKNCIALHQTYAHTLHCRCMCVFVSWLSVCLRVYHDILKNEVISSAFHLQGNLLKAVQLYQAETRWSGATHLATGLHNTFVFAHQPLWLEVFQS